MYLKRHILSLLRLLLVFGSCHCIKLESIEIQIWEEFKENSYLLSAPSAKVSVYKYIRRAKHKKMKTGQQETRGSNLIYQDRGNKVIMAAREIILYTVKLQGNWAEMKWNCLAEWSPSWHVSDMDCTNFLFVCHHR